MVMGDIPLPDCADGVEGPRGPFCIPFNTSSKPMITSCRVSAPLPSFALPVGTITTRYDGYKATSPRLSSTKTAAAFAESFSGATDDAGGSADCGGGCRQHWLLCRWCLGQRRPS